MEFGSNIDKKMSFNANEASPQYPKKNSCWFTYFYENGVAH